MYTNFDYVLLVLHYEEFEIYCVKGIDSIVHKERRSPSFAIAILLMPNQNQTHISCLKLFYFIKLPG